MVGETTIKRKVHKAGKRVRANPVVGVISDISHIVSNVGVSVNDSVGVRVNDEHGDSSEIVF